MSLSIVLLSVCSLVHRSATAQYGQTAISARNQNSIPAKDWFFFRLQRPDWLGPSRTFSPEVKRLGHEADHSPPFIMEVKNAGSCTTTPPSVFMSCCFLRTLTGYALFLLFQYLPGGTEEKSQNNESRWPIFGLRFDPITSQLRMNATHFCGFLCIVTDFCNTDWAV
jgi:hypothetical protein